MLPLLSSSFLFLVSKTTALTFSSPCLSSLHIISKIFRTVLERHNLEPVIWSHHFMGNRWGNSIRLYFWGSKITSDGDYSHEIKRRLLLGRKIMTNLDSIFKSRDVTLPTKFRLVKAMDVWMRELDCEESRAPKN